MYAEDFDTPAATSQPAKRRRIDNDDAVSDEDMNLASLLVGLSESDGGPSSSATAAGEVKKQKESPPSTAVDFKKQTEYSPSTDHPPPAQNNCYRCGVCGRTFPSYQALGGHKSSHRDKPAAAAASHKRKTLASAPTASSDPITGGRLHKCGDCGKNFPSGQALGGHKRKHYQGVIIGRGDVGAKIGGNTSEIDGGGSSGVTSSSGGGASSHSNGGAAPVRWNFDLNLPPPMDLDLSL